jgi:hypothetical protein
MIKRKFVDYQGKIYLIDIEKDLAFKQGFPVTTHYLESEKKYLQRKVGPLRVWIHSIIDLIKSELVRFLYNTLP